MRDIPDFEHWLERLEDLQLDADGASADDTLAVLCEWQGLLASMPRVMLASVGSPFVWTTFHVFVGAAAFDSAALSLLGEEVGYLLSRGCENNHIASITIPNCDEEFTRSGSTLALAVISAHVAALVARMFAVQLGRSAAS